MQLKISVAVFFAYEEMDPKRGSGFRSLIQCHRDEIDGMEDPVLGVRGDLERAGLTIGDHELRIYPLDELEQLRSDPVADLVILLFKAVGARYSTALRVEYDEVQTRYPF